MDIPSASPLALPFEEALQPQVFLHKLRSAAENQAKQELGEVANNALKSGLATAKFVFDRKGVTVVFEGGIPKGAKFLKDAARKALPILRDGKTGKLMKVGRVASAGRKAAQLSASAALAVVEVAHMISAHDNAQRLKRIERGVDALLHAHKSELKSRLEAIFRYSKELLYCNFNRLSDQDKQELHRQCRDLIEIRARWRDDFRFQLGQIKPAEVDWYNHVFWWTKDDALAASLKGKATEANEALEVVQLMHFSFMLQMTLAGAAGRLEEFQHCTLRDESKTWNALLDFASKRTTEICGTEGASQFREFHDAMTEVVAFWSPEKWEDIKRKNLAETSTPSSYGQDSSGVWASIRRWIGNREDQL